MSAALYAVAAVALVLIKGAGVGTFAACALCAVLVVASVTDLRARIVPNACIAVGCTIWVVLVAWQGILGAVDTATLIEAVVSSLAGALAISVFLLVVGGVFEVLAHKQGLGGGDIKLFFVTGLYLGLAGNALNLFLSCILGAFFGWWWNHRTDRGSVVCANHAPLAENGFPFAPAIALSTWVCLLL